MKKFNEHLTSRHLGNQKYCVDHKKEVVTFPLYDINLTLKGILVYNWMGSKETTGKVDSRYTPYVRKGVAVVYGLDNLDRKQQDVYLVEGVWDAIAIQNLGFNAIAGLTNNPKHITPILGMLKDLGFRIIAVVEGDKAGLQLAKYGQVVVYLPEGTDASSLTQDQLLTELMGE